MKNKDLINHGNSNNDKNLLYPILGQTYVYFTHGSITPWNKAEATITEIIPFDKIDLETLDLWERQLKSHPLLYAKETDYFIKADLMWVSDHAEKIILVRTLNDKHGWFGLPWYQERVEAGRLDIDGSLNALLNECETQQ